MKTPIEDGGPAFPATQNGPDGCTQYGMTLRDWFAGQALAGYMANSETAFSFVWKNSKGETRYLGYGATPGAKDVEGWHIVKTPDQAMAESMFAKADAMLAARKEQP